MLQEGDSKIFYWCTLRIFGNENKSVTSILEHINHRKLQDRILEVKQLKEYSIVESEEYPPNSDFLPKRGFKSSSKSAWVKISNGNYKRIRVVERRPFAGMIFIKMEYDLELFKLVRSWDAGFSFLGFPEPSIMFDQQMKDIEDGLNKNPPDLIEYINSKRYLLVEGSVSTFKNVHVEGSYDEEEKLGKEDVFEDKKSEMKKDDDQKAKIYSDLNIKQYEEAFTPSSNKKSSKKSNQKFEVNDLVFINNLGFKGVIQSIDYEKDVVIVGVQMFGRRQPVECKISEISAV